ncbi:MAG: ABC transporter permease [Anaerolineae bacterium]|nr:ABC transporter permease [Anaerolineae bacterium]MCB9132584.1 ABC transporter permease [Anaerolineales bacterium]MCB9141697.1 ABC transporter permease [Anaerolineales bacterium]
MNWRAIQALMRKDLKVVVQNKGVIVPIILLPLILFIVIPALVLFIPSATASANSTDLAQLLAMVAPGLRDQLVGLTPDQAGVVFFLVYMMAPLFLIVPLMVSNVIAADSFVGERERKTLEALLYTPTTDGELLAGKILSALVPAVVVSLVGYLIYTVTADLAAAQIIGRALFPNPLWNVLVLWVAPAAAGLGLTSMMLVSVRAKTFQDAYQTGSLVVLPIVLLLIGQITGVLYFNIWLTLALGLVLWIIDAVLLFYGRRTFHRSELIARL